MYYRASVSLAFDTEATAKKAIEKAVAQLPAAHTVNPGQTNEERGWIIVEQCFHDTDPSNPCIPIVEHHTP